IKLTFTFSKCLIGLMLGLCTHHIPLNQHLFHLTKSATPDCLHCLQIEETALHYLFFCLQYKNACHTLVCMLGRKSTSLSYLLAEPNVIPHLACYMNAMHRLRPMLEKILMPILRAD
ncbi:hypothetical protein BDR04DRAFT_1005240, partial [Suillus decipiens]